MKRTIPRSLVSKALNQSPEPSGNGDEAKVDTAPSSTTAPFKGAGSAWKAGALAQSQAAVEQGRAQLVDDVLNGRHELQISPDQVEDPLGSDRRDDWIGCFYEYSHEKKSRVLFLKNIHKCTTY